MSHSPRRRRLLYVVKMPATSALLPGGFKDLCGRIRRRLEPKGDGRTMAFTVVAPRSTTQQIAHDIAIYSMGAGKFGDGNAVGNKPLTRLFGGASGWGRSRFCAL